MRKQIFKKETGLLRLDNKKQKMLKWYPKWSLDYSIQKILEWNFKNKKQIKGKSALIKLKNIYHNIKRILITLRILLSIFFI